MASEEGAAAQTEALQGAEVLEEVVRSEEVGAEVHQAATEDTMQDHQMKSSVRCQFFSVSGLS